MNFLGDYFKLRATKLSKSEDYIADVLTYSHKLIEKQLPVIFSPLHWSLMMGMEYKNLNLILKNRESYYDEFRIKKKNGGYRYISSSNGDLFKIQYWLKIHVLDKLKFDDNLTSYQKGKSIFDNAKTHTAKELVIKLDLENYFESVTQDKVFGIFRFLGYNTAVAISMASACCINKVARNEKRYNTYSFACLPQGASTSPTLSNLAAIRIDLRISSFLKKKSYSYSRYADDLTLSGEIKNKPSLKVLDQIISSEGFILNRNKTRYINRSNRQIVTGLSVNEKVSIPKKFRKKIHTHLHNCVMFGPDYNLEKIHSRKLNYREWLLGNIIYIISLHPHEGRLMKEKFTKINWV